MPEPLTITLSPELSEKVRAQAASHGYASEAEFVEDNIAEAVEPESELEQWLKTVGVARYDAYDANTCDVLTEDEMLGHVTSGCVKPDEALCGASRERPTYY